LISQDALILFKGVDEVEKRLRGQLVAPNGLGQSDEDGGIGPAGETFQGLIAEIGQKTEGFGAVAGFVAEIVGDSAEGVDVAEILAQMAGKQERNNREVFVVRLGQAARLTLRVGQVASGCGRHVDG